MEDNYPENRGHEQLEKLMDAFVNAGTEEEKAAAFRAVFDFIFPVASPDITS